MNEENVPICSSKKKAKQLLFTEDERPKDPTAKTAHSDSFEVLSRDILLSIWAEF